MQKPLISVVIPLYNKEKSIQRTVNSVLKQTFDNIEIIIVNDGSTDNSVNILKNCFASNIIVINKDNGGVSSARNAGIKVAKADWLFFLDGDDVINPNCLKELYDLHLKFPDANLCCGNFLTMYEGCKGKVYCKGTEEYLVDDNFKDYWNELFFLRPGTVLIKKEMIYKIGMFDININVYEDSDFFIRSMDFCRIAYTPKVLFIYQKEHSEASKGFSTSKQFYNINLESVKGYKKKVLLDLLVKEMITTRHNISFSLNAIKNNRSNLLYIFIFFFPCFFRNIKSAQIFNRIINKFKL